MNQVRDPVPRIGDWRRRGTTVILDDPFVGALRAVESGSELSAEFESFATRGPGSAAPTATTVVGPCPDVLVPSSRRPTVLKRGSTHSAVREVQRKLNAFHAFRVAEGLSGLADTPLVQDCVFGRHTHNSVVSFQKLVFPGVPKEHDGKVGSRTWTQLDAITVGPSGTAQLTLDRASFIGASGPLGWDEVIGLDTPMINIQFFASGLPAAVMPPKIGVELVSRSPNLMGGATTLAKPVKWDVPLTGPDPGNPVRLRYQVSRPLSDADKFLGIGPGIDDEVATVARPGATSDVEFRRTLRATSRGVATQPTRIGLSTGSEAMEIPDAMALFRAAGVEVLELSVPSRPNWRVPGKVKRLVRSPADVLYYSGHGLSSSGKLVIDLKSLPCPPPPGTSGSYRNWLGPADLTPVWRSPMDLDVLILAGCSVLKIDFSMSPPAGPGLAWAGLLTAKGGPLVALLGYRAGAPCDHPNGNAIAKAMAARLAAGSTDFARDWLVVNGDNNATNAVAMDPKGYWWTESTWGGLSYSINGPITLP